MAGLPLLVPGVLLALLVAIAFGPRLGRALHTSSAIGALLVFSVALILAATLSPQVEALNYGTRSSGTCDLTLTLPTLSELLHPTGITLNVGLFVPLGLALGLTPRSSVKITLVAGSLCLPFVIEGIQLVVPVLDRACEASDVVYNLAGFALGFLAAWIGIRLRPGASA